MKEELTKILANHSGQNFEKVKADCDRDYFMSAEEAKAYGLVDEVIVDAGKKRSKVRQRSLFCEVNTTGWWPCARPRYLAA